MKGRAVRTVLLVGMEWFPDEPGGLNRYYYDLYRALGATGVSRRGVVVGPVTTPEPGLVPAGTMSDPLSRRLARIARTGRQLARRADVVNTHFALYAWPVVVPAWRRRPLVVNFQGPWAEESRDGARAALDLRARRWIERSVYRRADRLVVLSEAFRDVLMRDYGVPPWKIRVIPPGVDLAAFRPASDRVAARAALGVDGPLVFAARRLVARMGLDVLLDAWASASLPAGATLAVAGDGPDRAALAARAEQLGVAGSVRWLGRVSDDDLRAWYAAADVTVVPSVALEGFGLVVLESLASGTPVVATDVGGLPETLRGLDPSLVVPPGDTGALAARLAAALRGDVPDAAACRAYAERYDWAAVATRVLDTFEEATQHRHDRLRVVYVDHTAVPSGGELALVELVRALPDVDAHVILGADGPVAARLRAAGATVEILPLDPGAGATRRDEVVTSVGKAAGATAAYTTRLARRLRELRPDLVHTNSLKAAFYGVPAARLAGVPVIWHLRDRLATDYLPAAAVQAARALARLPDAVIANSRSTLETLGDQRCPAFVVPSPVRPVEVTRADGPFTVGTIARLSPWKGQRLFLEAFALAFGDDPDVEARVVGGALFGEDDYAAGLPAYAAELGLAGRVTFTGQVDDVAPELARLDVLAHCATVPEPFGQVVVQGMSAGLAVVAPDAGGPAEIVTDGVDGVLVPPNDAAALAAVLRKLRDDPALRAALGAAGRVSAARYAPDVVAGQVRAAYRDVVHRGRR